MISTRKILCQTFAETRCVNCSITRPVIHSASRSAVKALIRNPHSVITAWIMVRNFAGCLKNFKSLSAFLFFSSAIFSSSDASSEITAISAQEQNASMAIRTASILHPDTPLMQDSCAWLPLLLDIPSQAH